MYSYNKIIFLLAKLMGDRILFWIWGIVQKYNSNVNVSIVVDDASVENAWMNDVISSPLDILFLNYSIDTFSSHTCVCRLLRVLSRRKKKLKIFSFNLVLTEFTQTRDKYLFHLGNWKGNYNFVIKKHWNLNMNYRILSRNHFE